MRRRTCPRVPGTSNSICRTYGKFADHSSILPHVRSRIRRLLTPQLHTASRHLLSMMRSPGYCFYDSNHIANRKPSQPPPQKTTTPIHTASEFHRIDSYRSIGVSSLCQSGSFFVVMTCTLIPSCSHHRIISSSVLLTSNRLSIITSFHYSLSPHSPSPQGHGGPG